MINRRALLLVLGACATLPALRADAQPKAAPRRIAMLLPSTREFTKPQLEAFTARFAELGYVEGRDIVIEKRWADGSIERLPALARELLLTRK
ncbi:MAG: hypothetical protein HY017_15535 [Betaproteobacteria bacterium]|nr:hypothetical protein [Betaproteobacteria bacterium]